ncbi:MAG: UDP-N-acetylmuramoyl-tripeptide--D-alanyl-D-alanine ligase [Planctomycetota bacterium]
MSGDGLTPEFVRSATGGRIVARGDAPGPIRGVSIDTRSLTPGQVFVAIPGERSDGHTFLPQAAAQGAPLAIVERDVEHPAGLTVIRVGSCRRALVALAKAYRRELRSVRVVGVTGSNGKTTTVRLIDAVLGGSLRGSASIKSFNNELGVPLTVLNASPGDQYLVCEIGMSTPGEIRRLAAIARPHVAVVTSIGHAHLGGLGSIDAIMREKLSLLLELEPGGLGIVHDDPVIEIPPGVDADGVIRFGTSENAAVRVAEIAIDRVATRFELADGGRFRLSLLGKHNALNAAAAIAVGRRFGLDDAAIAAGLAAARGPAMRLDRATIDGIDVINDAYNANPESVKAAVLGFADFAPEPGRRVLVLGSMLELGELSEALHRSVGEAVAETVREGRGPAVVVLVGDEAGVMAPALREILPDRAVVCLDSVGDGSAVAEMLKPGDAVLLKASRSVALERVVEALRGSSAPAAKG